MPISLYSCSDRMHIFLKMVLNVFKLIYRQSLRNCVCNQTQIYNKYSIPSACYILDLFVYVASVVVVLVVFFFPSFCVASEPKAQSIAAFCRNIHHTKIRNLNSRMTTNMMRDRNWQSCGLCIYSFWIRLFCKRLRNWKNVYSICDYR